MLCLSLVATLCYLADLDGTNMYASELTQLITSFLIAAPVVFLVVLIADTTTHFLQ